MPLIKYSINGPPAFINKVDTVLNDPRGWRKYGFHFQRIDAPLDEYVHITLADLDTMMDKCGTKKLSCFSCADNAVWINKKN